MLCTPAIAFIIFALFNYTYYVRQGTVFLSKDNVFIFSLDVLLVIIINYICSMDYVVLAWVLAILPALDLLTADKFRTTPTITTTNKNKESFNWGRPISTMDYGSTPYSFY